MSQTLHSVIAFGALGDKGDDPEKSKKKNEE